MRGSTTLANRNGRAAGKGPAAAERPQVSWVFELEDDGTVIYSRSPFFNTSDEIAGHNFFDEGLGFEDISRCRNHFQSFIKSNKAAASFIWRCTSAGESQDTKVLMTRAFQTGSYPPTGVVMMEIRGC